MPAIGNFIEANLPLILVVSFLFNAVVLFLVGVVLIKIRKINLKSRTFFEGKNGKDLEEVVVRKIEEIKQLDKDIQDLYEVSNKINNLALRSVHRVGVIRFNPFKDIGGDQSFSVALLDGKNSGITISSLHTREGTRVYIKPINKGKSEKYPLTKEEERAILEAGVIKPEVPEK
jgi:hypothetical protein